MPYFTWIQSNLQKVYLKKKEKIMDICQNCWKSNSQLWKSIIVPTIGLLLTIEILKTYIWHCLTSFFINIQQRSAKPYPRYGHYLFVLEFGGEFELY
jgi:hypothetical protein